MNIAENLAPLTNRGKLLNYTSVGSVVDPDPDPNFLQDPDPE